jgi:hypothetical protein
LKAAGFVIRYRRGRTKGYIWGGTHRPVDAEAVEQRVEVADSDYLEAVARLTPQEKLARSAEMGSWAANLKAQTGGEP